MKNLFDIKGKVIVITGGCGILGKTSLTTLQNKALKLWFWIVQQK